MNSDQLNKFITVAKCKSMSEAADALFLTPSALSHAMHNLEKELGCQLFYRNKKGISLSANGELLLKYALKVSDILEEASSILTNQSKLTIASINACATFVLSHFPEEELSRVELKNIMGRDIPEQLLKHAVDIAICDDFYLSKRSLTSEYQKDEEIKKTLVYKEQLGIFVPKNHPLAEKEKICYAELKDIPLCVQMDKPSLTEWLSNIEDVAGKVFDIKFSLDRYSYGLLRDKIGYPEIREISSVYNPSRDESDGDYTFVRIDDFYSSRYIYMWYLKDNTEKVKIVLDSIKNFYTK